MKRSIFLSCLFFGMLMIGCNTGQAQQPENWTSNELMEPSVLAHEIQTNQKLPLIINVGPGAIIPHSLDIGMTSEAEHLEKFKNELRKLPKDTSIVIYCGCCPFAKCPNVRPAIAILKEMKFTNFHLLNIPQNIRTNWIAKGYPVVE